jgi:hypothetical protein
MHARGLGTTLGCAALGAALSWAPPAHSHFDIFVAESAGRTAVAGFDFDDGLIEETRIFEAEMEADGGQFVADEPGVVSGNPHPPSMPAGWLPLQQSPPLDLSFSVGTSLGFNLLYWDGLGDTPADVVLLPVPDAEVMVIEETGCFTCDVAIVDGGTARVPGFVIDDTSDPVHEHPEFFLFGDDSSTPDTPSSGVYVLSWSLSVTGLVDSRPFWIVYGVYDPADFPGLDEEEFDAFVESRIELVEEWMSGGLARTETPTQAQRTCIAEQARNAGGLTGTAARSITSCAREYAKGPLRADPAKLGGTFSAEACFAADVGSKVAASAARLVQKEGARCAGVDRDEVSRVPAFGFALSQRVVPAARSTPRSLAEDLLGPTIDATLAFSDPAVVGFDKQGSRCQLELLSQAQGVHDVLWRQASQAKGAALRGRDANRAPIPPPADPEEMADAVLAWLAADVLGAIQRRADRLVASGARQCASPTRPPLLPLGDLFPGACQSDAQSSYAALAECVVESARCRFCRQLEGSDGLSLGCDAFDDGLLDGSCPE